MQIKRIAISDGTRLPAAAFNAIKDGEQVLLGRAEGSNVYSPLPEHWGDVSMELAHRYIIENWESFPDDGAVEVKPMREAAEAKALKDAEALKAAAGS